MISENIEKLLNEQINHEMYSAYFYLGMASYFEQEGLNGISNWYMVQYKEETDHAMYFYKYLHNVDGKVDLLEIKKPENGFESVMDIFKRTLEHEQYVTSLINKIAMVARDEGDFRTLEFLQWFIKEQVEEEANAKNNIDRLRIAGDSGLFLLDQELSARIYTPSTNPPVML
ncbi:MAG: ferritin [Clostridiales bacterium]|nr:ferritin [Clostridiales bacterium]